MQLKNRNMIASGGRDRSIKIWKLVFYKDFKSNCLEKLHLDIDIPNAHSTDVIVITSPQYSPDYLFSGSSNGEVKIWDITTGSLLSQFKNSSGCVF